MSDTIYDTITVKQTVIDTVSRYIADSVTLKALENSQAFYSSAFSNFIVVVSVLAFILVAFTVVAVAFNFRSVSNSKKELEKMKKDFENKISELEEKVEKQIKNQKTIKIRDRSINALEIKSFAPCRDNNMRSIEFDMGNKKYLWGGKYNMDEEMIKAMIDIINEFKNNEEPVLDLDFVFQKKYPDFAINGINEKAEDKLNELSEENKLKGSL
jgi:septal ring factor EnvC (AmiA/AmiB activator)